MKPDDRKDEIADKYWLFLGYLEEYVRITVSLKEIDMPATQSLLITSLIKCMRPVLQADIAFAVCRDTKRQWRSVFHIVESSFDAEKGIIDESPLIKALRESNLIIKNDELRMITLGNSKIYFDRGIEKMPQVFRDETSALAATRIVFAKREYILFFCDIRAKTTISPRYTSFDQKMLNVAAGILQAGFQSGFGEWTQMKYKTIEIVILLVGLFGIAAVVQLLAHSVSAAIILPVLIICVGVILRVMGLLSSGDLTRWLRNLFTKK